MTALTMSFISVKSADPSDVVSFAASNSVNEAGLHGDEVPLATPNTVKQAAADDVAAFATPGRAKQEEDQIDGTTCSTTCKAKSSSNVSSDEADGRPVAAAATLLKAVQGKGEQAKESNTSGRARQWSSCQMQLALLCIAVLLLVLLTVIAAVLSGPVMSHCLVSAGGSAEELQSGFTAA